MKGLNPDYIKPLRIQQGKRKKQLKFFKVQKICIQQQRYKVDREAQKEMLSVISQRSAN